jgi:K+ potassium transporter
MLLSRYLNLDRHSPAQTVQQGDSLVLTLSETIDSTSDLSGRPLKGMWIKHNKVFRIGLLVWTLFGASCVMADGLLTPAVSVISAVAGSLVYFSTYLRYCRPCAQSQRFHCPNLHCDHYRPSIPR